MAALIISVKAANLKSNNTNDVSTVEYEHN
jgi:hypothetical protein